MNRRAALSLAGVAGIASVLPASAANDTKANKVTMQKYVQIWNTGKFEDLATVVSPKYISDDQNDAPGLDGFTARLTQQIQTNGYTVNKINYAIADMTAEGETVIARGNVTGVSSDGKKIKAAFFTELKFSGGLIVTAWNVFDQNAMFGF